MATITDYTTYEDIRAVLGVAEAELEDEVLVLSVYSNRLNMKMATLNSGLADVYDTVKAKSELARTRVETRFFNAVQVYATYATGRILLDSARMFAPQRIGDGKGDYARFNDPFAHLRDELDLVIADTEAILNGLLDELGEIVVPVTARMYFSVAGLVEDPVVGTGG